MDKPLSPCDEIQPLLSAQMDGELTLPEERIIAQHLAACTACRRQLDLLGSVDAFVASTVELSDDFLSRLSVRRRHPRRPAVVRRPWVGAIAALAAGLLLAATLFFPSKQVRIPTQQVINPLVALEMIDQHEEEARRSIRDTLALEVRALKLELQRADLDPATDAALMKRVERLESKVDELRVRENRLKQEIDL